MFNHVIKFIYKFKTCKKICKKYVKHESKYLIKNDILYYNIVIKPMKIKKSWKNNKKYVKYNI